MKDGQAKRGNRGLLIVLVVLVLAMLGLGGGILAVKLISSESKEIEVGSGLIDLGDDEMICDGESMSASSSNIENCITEAYVNEDREIKSEGDAELMFKDYDAVISRLERKGNYSEAADLVVDKINSAYFYLNDCDLAFQLLDNEDLSGYSDNLKGYIYSMAVGMGVECQNQEQIDKWKGLYFNVVK